MNAPRPWSGDPGELVGSVLAGRYAIEGVLGEGAMGVVYAGRHMSLGRAVAIKILRPELGRRPEFRERFLREAQAASRIGHPNVVQILDFGQDGALVFSVMEMLLGADLGQRLTRTGRLTWIEAAPIFLSIARALAAAHASRIVHRDVKPANVMLVGREGGALDVKVLDFGIAKLADDGRDGLTHHGAIMGTVAYMAPEQARGGAVDHRVDVYAFGVLMYRALTGVLPGPTDLVQRLARAVQVAPPRTLAPDLPPAIEAAIMRAMAESPSDRFQSMAELEAALAAAPSVAVEPTWAMNGEPALVRTPTYVLPQFQASAAADPTSWLPPQRAAVPPPVAMMQPSIVVPSRTNFTFAERPPRRGVVAAIIAAVAVVALGSGAVTGFLVAGEDEAEAKVEVAVAGVEADATKEPVPVPVPVPKPASASASASASAPESASAPASESASESESESVPEPVVKPSSKHGKSKPQKIDPTLARLQIEVASALPPASVRIDGKRRGRTPVVAKIPPGAHVVDFAWPDGRSFSQRVDLSKGQRMLVKGYAR